MPTGSLHTKMDVKVIILYILSRIETPLPIEEVYELAFVDDSLNYFVFAESLPELVDSGHLQQDEKGRYTITEKGRLQGGYVEDTLAFAARAKADAAINKKKIEIQKRNIITTELTQDENGNWFAHLYFKDKNINMVTVSLRVPNEELGKKMAENMKRNSSIITKTVMDCAVQVEKRSDFL